MHQNKINIEKQKLNNNNKQSQNKNNSKKNVLQQAITDPKNLNVKNIYQLHRIIGNQKVGQLLENQDQEKTIQKSENKTGIPDNVKTKMENAFNTDFSNVKVHQASSKAPKVGAIAYTQGHDIHFAPGKYNPSSISGQKLLGHELSHVVQQREGRVKPTGSIGGFVLNDSPTLEKEADKLGSKAAQMKLRKEDTQ